MAMKLRQTMNLKETLRELNSYLFLFSNINITLHQTEGEECSHIIEKPAVSVCTYATGLKQKYSHV